MIEFSSSIISSTISTMILYPAQRVKLQMLLSSPTKQKLDQDKELKVKKNNLTMKQAIKQIYHKHGWMEFYNGIQILAIGNGLSYGVYFVVYQKCKQILGYQPGSVAQTLKYSTIAGIVSTLTTNPCWVLLTKKQTDSKGSLYSKGKQLIQKQGILGLWKGLSSSIFLIFNPIIQFVIYQKLKKLLNIQKQGKYLDILIFLIGAISKMISTICTYPLIVIRTKQHVSKKKQSWIDMVKEILKNQGVYGLFKGIQPKMIQTVLNSALLLMLFQRIRNLLNNYFVNK